MRPLRNQLCRMTLALKSRFGHAVMGRPSRSAYPTSVIRRCRSAYPGERQTKVQA